MTAQVHLERAKPGSASPASSSRPRRWLRASMMPSSNGSLRVRGRTTRSRGLWHRCRSTWRLRLSDEGHAMTDRHIVVDHVLFVVSDLDESRRLYTAALARLGIEELEVEEDGIRYGRHQLDVRDLLGSATYDRRTRGLRCRRKGRGRRVLRCGNGGGWSRQGRAGRLGFVLGSLLRGFRGRPSRQQRRGRLP
jgi:hypothetical protein